MNPSQKAKYIPQITPIDSLYLTGNWVWPGIGVFPVMYGGYYLAKKILQKEDIDLTENFKIFLKNNK